MAGKESHNLAAAQMANGDRKANGVPPDSRRYNARLEVCADSEWAVQNVVVSFVGKEKWNLIRGRNSSTAVSKKRLC